MTFRLTPTELASLEALYDKTKADADAAMDRLRQRDRATLFSYIPQAWMSPERFHRDFDGAQAAAQLAINRQYLVRHFITDFGPAAPPRTLRQLIAHLINDPAITAILAPVDDKEIDPIDRTIKPWQTGETP